MAPPRTTTSTKRMTANPSKPARHRPGKPTADSASSASDDEAASATSDNDEAAAPSPAQPHAAPPPKASSFPADAAKRIAQNLRHVDLDARRREGEARERERRREEAEVERAGRERLERDAGFVTESEDESGENSDGGYESAEETKIDDVARMGGVAAGALRRGAARPAASEEEDEEDDEDASDSDSGSDNDSDSDASSSSDDNKRRFQRPVFVPKSQRSNPPPSTLPSSATTTAAASADPTTRQRKTDALVEAKLAEAAAARAAGRKEWDDDEAGEADAVDDTDGLEPELEHAQWVARELGRLKRARAGLEAQEAERAEIERRRGLTAAERAAEDEAVLGAQQEAKDGRAKAGFLARYHHRGAFFREDAEREGVFGRELMGARFVDQSAAGKEALPAYLQVRDATRIGRKGRTRYKDLKSEDTGRWGELGDGKGRDRAAFVGDERFRPDRPGPTGATGPNASSIGDRKRSGGQEREEGAKRARIDER